MPPKRGGGGSNKRSKSRDKARQLTTTTNDTQLIKNLSTSTSSQSKFTIAPLIIEGARLKKLELNDLIKKHMTDVRVCDIQLSRSGIFTLYAADVNSFNRLLNDFTQILAANGQTSVKIFVPRSIQRIKNTEKVAFVKRVDIEIPESRIPDALMDTGFNVESVVRLTTKDRNTPTRTIKIISNDSQNRNAFVQTGLKIDSMYFPAEPAMQNKNPVQCYLCLQYNQKAKYCKTKQQVCARCGGNHHVDQCNDLQQNAKCCNCQGDHLATSHDCPKFKEQEKRIQSMINQYASTTTQVTTKAPDPNNAVEFPFLHNGNQRHQDYLHNEIIEEIIQVLTAKMEKIIEETTNRLFTTLYRKIIEIEKSLASGENVIEEETTETEPENDKIIQDLIDNNNAQQQDADIGKPEKQYKNATASPNETSAKPPKSTNDISTKPQSTANATSAKPTQKPKTITKTIKKICSPNSSLDPNLYYITYDD
ncbi:unnamed protein product [Rotaria sp. Silwood2]|nr:unnamed protein product [Rotaria sp. Silwood2]CAF4557388.1 unnamed protein product [Rotaria sp. Silwood2]